MNVPKTLYADSEGAEERRVTGPNQRLPSSVLPDFPSAQLRATPRLIPEPLAFFVAKAECGLSAGIVEVPAGNSQGFRFAGAMG